MPKKQNQYAAIVQRGKFYAQCPKAVFAALAVSYASRGGDFLGGIEKILLKEWWILYQNQIVPQKPPMPEPEEVEQEFLESGR